MRRFLSKVLTIVWKDVLVELRTKDLFSAMIFFALLVVVIFDFAFEPGTQRVLLVAPGVLWVAYIFAGILGLSRSFVLEKDRGCLEGLLLCPVEREALYLGKMLGNFLFMLIMEGLIFFPFAVLLNLPLFLPRLVPVAVLATLGLAAVGSLFSAMAVHTKAREIMLPLLLLPVVVPVIIAAVKATGLILAGEPWSALTPWWQILVAFDVIFLVVSALTFEFVVME